MRVARWVPLYRCIVPIPLRLALSFGLAENSELHLAPITDSGQKHRFGCEVMVSPIPFQSWRRVCRLSIRLKDQPKALATATGFLRQKRINVLLCEACSTYQERFHMDAVCDLSLTPGFSENMSLRRESYEKTMEDFLASLNQSLNDYMEDELNRKAFLLGPEKHAQFTPLTGLNDAAFVCKNENKQKIEYSAGGIELPPSLTNYVSRSCGFDEHVLPKYAMITGNTEQRYLRILFLKEYSHLFRLAVRSDIVNFSGGGVGVLDQILHALPDQINLVKASNYILEQDQNEQGINIERSHIEMIGHWDLPDTLIHPQAQRQYMLQHLTEIVGSLVLEDLDHKKHEKTLMVTEFHSPRDVYPKVFISYSIGNEKEKLERLMKYLREHDFEPVLGTDPGQEGREGLSSEHRVASDVVQGAFQMIRRCVAFISLQVRREDFKVREEHDQKVTERYILPHWTVAEEVYAWASDVGFIIRLRDSAVEAPRYNQNVLTEQFSSEAEFENALELVINHLNRYRGSDKYKEVRAKALESQFQETYPPTD